MVSVNKAEAATTHEGFFKRCDSNETALCQASQSPACIATDDQSMNEPSRPAGIKNTGLRKHGTELE